MYTSFIIIISVIIVRHEGKLPSTTHTLFLVKSIHIFYILIVYHIHMLFLVVDHIKLGFVEPDIALAQMTMLKQTFDIYKDLKREGKLKFSYAFADSLGGITLWNVESNEELQRILFLLPPIPLIKRTVKPLTEMATVESVIEELNSIISSMPKKFG